MIMRAEIDSSVLREFRAIARNHFPREAYAFLFGKQLRNGRIRVVACYEPDLYYHSETTVRVPLESCQGAQARADEKGLQIVGDIHSHPRQFEHWNGYTGERSPSEDDLIAGTLGLAGICVVSEQRDGRLRTSIQFFGQTQPLRWHVVPARKKKS